MKRIGSFFVFFLTLCLISFAANAQLSLFRMFEETHIWRNPAYAGARERPVAAVAGRLQWLNFDPDDGSNAYRGYLAAFDAPWAAARGGWGATYLRTHDMGGAFRQNELRLNYAYRAQFAENAELRMGLAAGIRYHRIRTEGLRFPSQYDALTGLDPNRPGGASGIDEHRFSGSFSPGLWLRLGRLKVGASCANLLLFGDNLNSPGNDEDLFRYSGLRVVYLNARYTQRVGDLLEITPSVMTRRPSGEPNLDTYEARATVGLAKRRLFVGGGATFLELTHDWGARHSWNLLAGGRPVEHLELAALVEFVNGPYTIDYELVGPTLEFSAAWFFGDAPD